MCAGSRAPPRSAIHGNFYRRRKRTRRWRKPASGSSKLHHLLELSLPVAKAGRDRGCCDPAGVSRCCGTRLGDSWQHINLLGEYDFSDEKLQDNVGGVTECSAKLGRRELWVACAGPHTEGRQNEFAVVITEL